MISGPLKALEAVFHSMFVGSQNLYLRIESPAHLTLSSLRAGPSTVVGHNSWSIGTWHFKAEGHGNGEENVPGDTELALFSREETVSMRL